MSYKYQKNLEDKKKKKGGGLLPSSFFHLLSKISRTLLAASIFFSSLPPLPAFADLIIPSGSTVDVDTGILNVAGNVLIEGELSTSTGTVGLTGNWTNDTGVYTSGTGDVNFNGAVGTQTLESGGTGANQDFHDINHTGASTVQIVVDNVDINNDFTQTAGTFTPNGFNMLVAGDWSNSGTFTPSVGSTVTFDGADQSISGNTTFFNLTKSLSAGPARTLTFEKAMTQTISGTLTMDGFDGTDRLLLRSSEDDLDGALNDRWNISLASGGLQVLDYLDVKDSDAGGGLTLVARTPNSLDSGNNNNWVFGAAVVTWQGDGGNTNWNNANNWNLGFVPTAIDAVVIPDVTGGGGVQPILNVAATVANLSLSNTTATLTTNGFDLTVSSTLSNEGVIILDGNEAAISIGTVDLDSGTFRFIGDSDGASENFSLPNIDVDVGDVDYFNVDIRNLSATADSFNSNTNLVLAGSLTVTSGVFDVSTSANTITIGQDLVMAGGTLTATFASLDVNRDVTIGSGVLTAPNSSGSFTIAGDFTQTGGTFTHSSGTVTLDGNDQTISANGTIFRNLVKSNSDDILTFVTGISGPTIVGQLTLTGLNGLNPLRINSNSAGVKADIALQAGGTQTLLNLEVRDSDALGGVALIARSSTENPTSSTSNWFFAGGTMTWQGDDGTTPTDWNTAQNWNLGIVPIIGDTALIPSVANDPTLATDITVDNITIDLGATVTLAGNDFKISTNFLNEGTVSAQGTEAIVLTPDTNSGTFVFTGNNSGVAITLSDISVLSADFYNLVINDAAAVADTFQTNGTLTVANNLTVTSGTLNTSLNSNNVAIVGNATVNGGTWTATNSNINLDGSFTISAGTMTAPTVAKSFTVGNDWTNSGGLFTTSSGKVTFDTLNLATITGSTTFTDLESTVGGKTFEFTAGSTQTVAGTINLVGSATLGLMTLKSTVNGADWNLISTNGDQVSLRRLHIFDGEILGAAGDDFTCFVCTDGGGNDNLAATPHWIFSPLRIITPDENKTTDQTPTVIGAAVPGDVVVLRDVSNNIVGTVTANTDGNWRIEVSALALNLNSLTPYVGPSAGATVVINVLGAPMASQQPTITSHVDNDRIGNPLPTLVGQTSAGATVTVIAADVDGDLLQQVVGTGVADGSGEYSITLTVPLVGGLNLISVTADGVASDILNLMTSNPFGVVFDSVTNAPIAGATISIYRAADNQLADVSDLDATDTNPFVTPADGIFWFIANPGNYYLTMTAEGYDYPSVLTVFPGTRTVTTGSKGDTFTIVSSVTSELDQPMDSNASLIRLVKTVNKKEARVGEVVTYTISIQNLSATTNIIDLYLRDNIPPGFKYLTDRVTLDGVPIANPEGTRPVIFNIGTLAAQQIRELKYQLVVGSGVTMGTYKNEAYATNIAGIIQSNIATQEVKVVADPLFDLGTVLGKVFFDYNENGIQDAPEYVEMDHKEIIEDTVPNVRIAMEDGTLITTDANGQFSIPALSPGRHLFRIDERTLPEGSYLTTDKVVVVDVTDGALVKVNFGVNIGSAEFDSADEQYFARNVKLLVDDKKPEPRLNVQMFEEEAVSFNGLFVNKVQFRIFTNYAAFIEKWRLEIKDSDTKKVIRKFEGSRYDILDPMLWNGKDDTGEDIRIERKYEYILYVEDAKGHFDETKPLPITIRNFEEEEDDELEEYVEAKKKDEKDYKQWLKDQNKINNLGLTTIIIEGETLRVDQIRTELYNILVKKNGSLVVDVPVLEHDPLTARDVLEGKTTENQDSIDIILPKGDYEIMVQETKAASAASAKAVAAGSSGTMAPGVVGASMTAPNGGRAFTKAVKVGEDYLFFVGLGDAKAGYTMNRGNIEPVDQDDQYRNGFWTEGKAAYYLKGKILGKYLVTSSYDSERTKKEIFRNLDPDQYYPVYGDQSTKNYEATDTQGNLFLLIEWDKSSARWSNYNVDFGDTEFARYSRSLYGGKIDYKSVGTTKFGDPNTQAIVFTAQANQKSAHNEFVATGGSLYFTKQRDIIEGSDKVKVEVRDQITGLVLTTKEMTEGADYEIDYNSGRIIFWQPVTMLVQGGSIISNNLLAGNPVYVIVDYEYEPPTEFSESSMGARVKEAVGDHVMVGTTYVKDAQEEGDFALAGTDVTLKIAQDASITAELASSESDSERSFISTDGGITFNDVTTADDAKGIAYGLKGDMKLFNRMGFKPYYKWIENDFSTSATTAQQGKELVGFEAIYDLTEATRMTARYDVQTLIDDGSDQARLQVGAVRTATTMLQVVHELRKLKLTAEYQRNDVKERMDEFDTETNTASDTVAVRADYEVSDKLSVALTQQASLTDKDAALTTVGATIKPIKPLTITGSQSFGSQGSGTNIAVKADVTQKLELNADYAVTNSKTGESTAYGTVGAEVELSDQMKLKTSIGSDGTRSTTVAAGASKKLGNDKALNADVSTTASLDGTSTSASIGGQSQVDDKTTTEGKVTVTQVQSGFQNTTFANDTEFTFGTTRKLTDELEVISSQTLGAMADGSQSSGNKYSLVRTKEGKRLEGSIARELLTGDTEVSQSNIFGLSGDIDDRWALSANVERGRVNNFDGSQTARQVASVGLGYRKEDKEEGQDFKSSTKIEYRDDEGDTDRRQYLVYQAIEGKINPEISLFTKVEFSRTRNLTTEVSEASHREIVIGGAYRPIFFDRLNLLARYTYLEEVSPSGQEGAILGLESNRMQVLAGEGIYDIDEHWQLVEKFGMRVLDEKIAGFPFNRTHTWLMIHRLNYKVNQDWKIGAEYRRLTQIEAEDSRHGFLLEVARQLGEYAELGIGYNFTQFSDDLTHLDYDAQGPYVRLTGKAYDRSPEEIERARKKLIDQKVGRWAWMMVEEEMGYDDSPVLAELNDYYAMAQTAYDNGDWAESKRIYKDIIQAGQMMFEDARQYIYKRIEQEETWKSMQKQADQFIKEGQYEKAKKILEKIMEEVQGGM